MALIEYGGRILLLVSLGCIYGLEISKVSPELYFLIMSRALIGGPNRFTISDFRFSIIISANAA